jgi:hypothetical protein
MERFALFFTIKPGKEKEVAEIFRNYGRPSAQASSETRLISTTVFMKGNIVVRVFDIDGKLEDAMAFLPQQEAIRKVEEKLNPLLEHPRDFAHPEDARRFFQQALMQRITHRVAGEPVRGTHE